jgi:hypothetical protein
MRERPAFLEEEEDKSKITLSSTLYDVSALNSIIKNTAFSAL